ncbi:MAG: hypothetical protein M5T61_18860 [Acidimicrobiia bacterium]|nr:hypothetical protein [Acidimicrobiia bacterium]
MIGDVLGIPNLSQLLSLPGLASHFNGKGSLGKLLGITDVTSLLSRVIQALNPFAMFGVGSGTSDSSAFFPSVPRIAIDDALDLHAVFKERFYGLGAANPLPDLPFRPSISLSGSFGGQFFGGGSIGLSQQLDAGKSTVQSKGSQGQVHDTLTYYRPDNVTWSDTEVVSSDVSRWTIREHLHERDEEYVWKGKEARYGGRPLDVVLATIPVGLILQPQAAPVPPDAFRIRVGHLPPDVTLDVTYMGTAHPIAPQALTAAFPGVGAPMLPTGGGPIAPGTPGDGSGSSSPAGEVDARDSDPRDGQ